MGLKILTIVIDRESLDRVPCKLAGFAICLALCGLSWRYVEEPVLRWRDRARVTREEPVPVLV